MKLLELIPSDVESVLDVGCGRGLVGYLCLAHREPARLVGIDIFEPYLKFVTKHGLYNEVLKHDLNELPLPYVDREFDLVTAVEVIEHLEEERALHLIEELERVAKEEGNNHDSE